MWLIRLQFIIWRFLNYVFSVSTERKVVFLWIFSYGSHHLSSLWDNDRELINASGSSSTQSSHMHTILVDLTDRCSVKSWQFFSHTSGMALGMAMFYISTTIGWITAEFCPNIHGAHKMNPNDFGDPLFLVALPWCSHFLFWVICLDNYYLAAMNFAQAFTVSRRWIIVTLMIIWFSL